MKTKIIALIGLFYPLVCSAHDIDKVFLEVLVTRYVSILNANAGPNALPKNEIKREIFLALIINYFYLKDQKADISSKFKGIAKSIGKKLEGFVFSVELENYIAMIKSTDKESAVFRLTLDGFDEKTANLIVEKAENNNFKDLIEWFSTK